jgi:hypothetical protein
MRDDVGSSQSNVEGLQPCLQLKHVLRTTGHGFPVAIELAEHHQLRHKKPQTCAPEAHFGPQFRPHVADLPHPSGPSMSAVLADCAGGDVHFAPAVWLRAPGQRQAAHCQAVYLGRSLSFKCHVSLEAVFGHVTCGSTVNPHTDSLPISAMMAICRAYTPISASGAQLESMRL